MAGARGRFRRNRVLDLSPTGMRPAGERAHCWNQFSGVVCATVASTARKPIIRLSQSTPPGTPSVRDDCAITR